MTLKQKQLVCSTAVYLSWIRLPALFFKHTNMPEQRKKLMYVIGTVVNGLNVLDQLIPAVSNLGRRHTAYGVTDEHYASVGRALIWALEQGLGADFTPEVKDAWTTVYDVLANTMKNATAQAGASRCTSMTC
jgi:hemoglobin-like flavoprotein